MKIILSILIFLMLLNTEKVSAQFNLVQTLDSIFIGSTFFPVKISNTETKFVKVDTAANTFSLLNLDFSPFITNISLPAPFWPNYRIGYVSRTLFDCDSTNIEFAYEEPMYYGMFYVIRTDGTILFQVPGFNGPYCFGCSGAMQDVRPIFNTENGARLILQTQDTSGNYSYRIYELCDSLSEDIFSMQTEQLQPITLYPNPTSETITVDFSSLTNFGAYTFEIYDNNSKLIQKFDINPQMQKLTFNVKNYSSGSYVYRLNSKYQIVQSGKFILNK